MDSGSSTFPVRTKRFRAADVSGLDSDGLDFVRLHCHTKPPAGPTHHHDYRSPSKERMSVFQLKREENMLCLAASYHAEFQNFSRFFMR